MRWWRRTGPLLQGSLDRAAKVMVTEGDEEWKEHDEKKTQFLFSQSPGLDASGFYFFFYFLCSYESQTVIEKGKIKRILKSESEKWNESLHGPIRFYARIDVSRIPMSTLLYEGLSVSYKVCLYHIIPTMLCCVFCLRCHVF